MGPSGPTIVRVYHGGRDPGHQARDRALAAAGARVVLVVPQAWPAAGQPRTAPAAPGLEIVEVAVSRAGDVNRHRHREIRRIATLLHQLRPDILDVHEEPVSVAMRQLLTIAPAGLPVVGYTAQNLDKRFPPPYAQFERSSLARLAGMYPCSRQAASVVWGKGFRGLVRVLPLGQDATVFRPGDQRLTLDAPLLVLAGRLVPEKGVRDAVAVLAAVRRRLPGRLVLVGMGPEVEAARSAAAAAGVGGAVTHLPWLGPAELAGLYRQAHVVLAPSRSTPRWVEQFGRMVSEAQASGAVVCGYSTGALPEVGGDAAALVEEGDTEKLGRTIIDIVTDATEWDRRRALGLAAARTRTWEAVAQAQARFYEQVLREPGRRRAVAPDAVSRHEARRLYGPPATARDILRPFAVPVLRELGETQVGLGRLVDAVQRIGARARDR